MRLGKSDYRNKQTPFRILSQDLRQHCYLVGKTGSGKSTQLLNMALQADGLALIDPHGALAAAFLDRVKNTNNIVYFHPDDPWPLSLNILASDDPNHRDLMVSRVVSVFKSIWGPELVGPRSEDLLRNALFAIAGNEGATLLWIPKLITDRDFRRPLVEKIENPVVRHFWEDEFEKYHAKFEVEATAPILNKLRAFLSVTNVRNVLVQPKRKLSMKEIMARGQVLICDLAKGRIGEENAGLLMSLIAEEIFLDALTREEGASDFMLAIDEVQNVTGFTLAAMLSESRKYGLNLVLSNQYTQALRPEILDSILGNVGNYMIFRVGAEDAELFGKELRVDPYDLMMLPNYHCWVKILYKGETLPAFSAITYPAPKMLNKAEKIKRFSRQRFGTDRAFVEAKTREFMGL